MLKICIAYLVFSLKYLIYQCRQYIYAPDDNREMDDRFAELKHIKMYKGTKNLYRFLCVWKLSFSSLRSGISML